MKKTIASLILLFVMLTNLNATEAPTVKSDNNCSTEKCKIKKSTENNCSVEKCKIEKKADCKGCDAKDCQKCNPSVKRHCLREMKQNSNKTVSTWSVSKEKNSSIKAPSCCKNKKKEESKEEKPMKCATGKCGGGKCGGK